MSKDYKIDLVKKKIAIIGCMFFGGIGIFLGAICDDILLILISLAFFLLGFISLIKGVGRQNNENIKDYIPGKDFKYLRTSASQKIKSYTKGQYILGIVTVIIIIVWILHPTGAMLKCASGGVVAILVLQYILKARIKLSVPIDDATYFELEEMSLIEKNDVVKSIYKDFESWEDVEEGRKALIVTQDNLVCVNFESREDATKVICPLSKIKKVNIVVTGRYGQSYLLTIGYGKDFLNIKLFGDSEQDSPEEFLACFLKELDRCLLGNENGEIRRLIGNTADIPVNSNIVPRYNIRYIDLNIPGNTRMQSNNDVNEFDDNHQNKRVIEL